MVDWLKRVFGGEKMVDAEFQARQEEILREIPIPVFWLFGKTGSGKTSIVRFLTGAADAEIGSGYRPQTQRSRRYDFPSADAPLLSFVDTRGLGEARYDPKDDIDYFDQSTHLMIVTVRAMDHAVSQVVESLCKIRAAKPQRPVLLALTCLHEGYPNKQHPSPDPFDDVHPKPLPDQLARSLQRHRELFKDLADRVVPIDLTRPEDGFDDPHFGGQRLRDCLVELLPAAYRQTLLSVNDSLSSLRGLHERRAMPYVLSYSAMAATAGAVPIPWVDIPLVMAIQSRMVKRIAAVYRQPLDAPAVAAVSGLVAGRIATRLLLRGIWKLIPYAGIAANAAVSYAYTYGLGRTCCWYFGKVRQGAAPSEDELRRVWHEQISLAASKVAVRWPGHNRDQENLTGASS